MRRLPGDLGYVGTQPLPASSPWTAQQQGKEIRRALFHDAYRPVGLPEAVMVHGRGEDGIMRVRLVQDYGRPEDPDAPLSEAKRKPGRPAKADAE